MSSAVIGTEMCPACGRVVWLVRLMPGLHYSHTAYDLAASRDWSGCFGTPWLPADDAHAVQAIREREGDRLRLAAHP